MRKPMLYAAVGRKGSGKTTQTVKILRDYARSRKVLIFDTQDEYSEMQKYPDIRSLSYDQVSVFSRHPEISIRRIPPFKFSGEAMTPDEKEALVLHILDHYRNGMLMLEDINNYIYDYVDSEIVGKILSQRHKGIDIVMHFHSLGRIQKKIWPHLNVLRLHKCEDSVIDNKEKFQEKYELFKIAENLVNAQFDQGNEYFSVEVLISERQIVGEFTEDDRTMAIDDYIYLHYTKLINPYLNRINREGIKQHTEATALQAERQRIEQTYFK